MITHVTTHPHKWSTTQSWKEIDYVYVLVFIEFSFVILAFFKNVYFHSISIYKILRFKEGFFPSVMCFPLDLGIWFHSLLYLSSYVY